jgi:hypothetical protein
MKLFNSVLRYFAIHKRLGALERELAEHQETVDAKIAQAIIVSVEAASKIVSNTATDRRTHAIGGDVVPHL